MKKIVLFAVLIWWSFGASAQQLPLFSQYFHNPFIYNPAWAGLDKFASVNLSHRVQWDAIKGGPVTSQFTLDLPFYQYRCGLGVNVYQDKIGIFTQNKLQISYAYHIFQLYENASVLSFGITGGLMSNRMDFSNALIFDPGDPRIVNNTGNYQGLEFSFGLNYRFRDKFQAALVVPQLLNAGMRSIDNSYNNINPVSHYLFTVKCTLKTADEMHRIEPMLMLRKVPNTPLQFDIGAQYTYNNTLWANMAFRADYAATVAAGITIKRFRAGYSRDFAVGAISGVAGSTNEFMVGYKFNHIPTYDYDGRRGKSNTNRKRKIMHPSRPGPVMGAPKNNLKGTKKKKPGSYKRRR